MCDPMGMLGMVFSVGSAVMQMQAQQDLMSKQNSANEQWLAYQRMKSRQEAARQEAARQKADASRQESLSGLDAQKQIDAQGVEQKRLEGEYGGPNVDATPASGDQLLVGDKLLQGAGSKIQAHYADALANATQEARQRIKNLATVQSYTGSQFGLANRANQLLGQSADDIRLQGDIRQGSLVAYGVEKAVEPIKYQMGSGAGAFGGIASGLAGGAGKALGTALAGSV